MRKDKTALRNGLILGATILVMLAIIIVFSRII